MPVLHDDYACNSWQIVIGIHRRVPEFGNTDKTNVRFIHSSDLAMTSTFQAGRRGFGGAAGCHTGLHHPFIGGDYAGTHFMEFPVP
jgi:hypothetical protein